MYRKLSLLAIATLVTVGVSFRTTASGQNQERPYEIWLLDQSDTREDGSGTLYIYQGSALNERDADKATPEVIDLGGAVRDYVLSQTGSAPRRPHLAFLSPTHSHVILTYVATGHVLFLDSANRQPVAAIDVGEQAHAAIPTPDQRYVVVSNQNGKKFVRIRTDYAKNSFVVEPEATLDLANGTTPSGAPRQDPVLRPDNAPICMGVSSDSRLAFVTLRGGGHFVVDITRTPMAIVAEYDRTTVHPNGCVAVEANGKMYVNAGGGIPTNPHEADLYAFPLDQFPRDGTANPPNTPAPRIVFSHDDRGEVDSHGAMVMNQGRYIWNVDRAANRLIIIDTENDTVVEEINLAGALTNDPAPDWVGQSPSGSRFFFSMRGPNPLTGNDPAHHNAVGNTPGIGIVEVSQNGRSGVLQAVVRISRVVDGKEMADPHGMAVVYK